MKFVSSSILPVSDSDEIMWCERKSREGEGERGGGGGERGDSCMCVN